ncbi:hypothetical protein NUSPORA_02444 [Nucleospora cyclopteri]
MFICIIINVIWNSIIKKSMSIISCISFKKTRIKQRQIEYIYLYIMVQIFIIYHIFNQ